jgi:hypothetical protein
MCLPAAIIEFADFTVTVQLRGSDSGPEGHDRQTAGARDWVQNHGARPRLHEGQEEGKCDCARCVKLFHISGDLSPANKKSTPHLHAAEHYSSESPCI